MCNIHCHPHNNGQKSIEYSIDPGNHVGSFNKKNLVVLVCSQITQLKVYFPHVSGDKDKENLKHCFR